MTTRPWVFAGRAVFAVWSPACLSSIRGDGESVTARREADALPGKSEPEKMHSDSINVDKCFLRGRMKELSNLGFSW
ncbi:hypothetical protein AZH11_25780 [Pseudomonas simiae]|nr:hypothetical protein AZH11_25780 [Pseudomonas simiae]